MNRHVRTAVLALLGLLVGLGGTLAPGTATAVTAGSIGGTVVEPSGVGEPAGIAGVEVMLYAQASDASPWAVVASTSTDGEGAYVLGGVASGTYRVGFHPTTDHVAEYWNDMRTLEHADGVVVADGEAVALGTTVLSRAGHVTGRVTGHGELPLEGVEVRAYMRTYPQGWRATRLALTDANGFYDLNGLEEGTYRLGFEDVVNGHVPEFWQDASMVHTAHDVLVSAGSTTAGKDARLVRGGHISGRVTNAGGAPLGDVEVLAYRWNAERSFWDVVRSTEADFFGHYAFDRLATGEYRIGFRPHGSAEYAREFWGDATTVWTGTSVHVDADGAAMTGRNAALDIGGAISGAVTGTTTMDDVWVVAHQNVGGTWRHVWEVWVRNDGTYRLDRLPAGTYRLEFIDHDGVLGTEFWDDKPSIGLATDVTVASRQTSSGRNAALRPSGAGTTNPTPTTPPPAPVPVPSAGERLAEILAAVKVAGRTKVGRTLRVKNLVAGARYKVQWYAGRSAIGKATKARLVLTRALVGKVVSVKVRATTDGVSRTRKVKVGRVRG